MGGISVEFHVSANNRLKVGLVRERSPSMRMLMNRICIALSGLLSPNIVLSVISVSAAAAVLSWNDRKFWMLWNIDFPVTPSWRSAQWGWATTHTTYLLRRPAGWC